MRTTGLTDKAVPQGPRPLEFFCLPWVLHDNMHMNSIVGRVDIRLIRIYDLKREAAVLLLFFWASMMAHRAGPCLPAQLEEGFSWLQMKGGNLCMRAHIGRWVKIWEHCWERELWGWGRAKVPLGIENWWSPVGPQLLALTLGKPWSYFYLSGVL